MPTRKSFILGLVDEHSRTVPVLASTPNPVDGEALATWDLTRFLKNPIVLFNHDVACPIGTAFDVKMTPAGLAMVLKIASGTPLCEEIWQLARQGVLKTVSVGFAPGAARTEADGSVTRTSNELLEVSVVSVPADEDAGTVALLEKQGEQTADDQAARGTRANDPPAGAVTGGGTATEDDPTAVASAAARALAMHRHRKTENLDAGDVVHFDYGSLGTVERTQVGGARIKARLCRIGVLVYRNPDGSIRRELRLPEEVFHPDSLATLHGAPVIDIKDHTGMVTPETWRKVSLGHTEKVHTDSDHYVSAELVVQDAEALERIDRGERTEISCGYVCRNEASPGVWNGQPYDVIQRGIRYNHVALCPPQRGRAGPDVGLRFDANGAPCAIETEEEPTMKTIRLDGKDYEIGSKEHLDKVDEMHATALAAVNKKADEAIKKADEAQGRFDAADAALKKEKAESEAYKAKRAKDDEDTAKKFERKVRRRVRLMERIQRLFGKDDDAEKDGDKDEDKDAEKMDAADGVDAAERDMMLGAIKKANPEFSAEGRSADYIAARFDSMAELLEKNGGVDSVVVAVKKATERLDSNNGSKDIVAEAEAAMIARNKNAWKTPNVGGNGAAK